jgi:hypothetical protein
MSRKPGKAQRTIRAKRGTASKPARNWRPSAARLARELAAAREQQEATSEVLRVISMPIPRLWRGRWRALRA